MKLNFRESWQISQFKRPSFFLFLFGHIPEIKIQLSFAKLCHHQPRLTPRFSVDSSRFRLDKGALAIPAKCCYPEPEADCIQLHGMVFIGDDYRGPQAYIARNLLNEPGLVVPTKK